MAPDRRSTIDVPAPTAWPMIAAFGITLAWAGLVTNALVTVVGVIATLWGAVGWFRDVLPVQRLEPVRVEPDPVIAPSPRGITYVQAGEVTAPRPASRRDLPVLGGHRGRHRRRRWPWRCSPALYGLIFHGSVWYPINLLAAGTMASLATATPEELARFHGPALAVASLVHAVMSLLVGLLYAVLLPMVPRRPILFGGIVVPLLWTGLIWASLRIVNPILNARIDWPWFVASQLAFGIAAGLVVSRREKIATQQHVPLAVRAGIEFAEEDRER